MDYLLEIGAEELPAGVINDLAENFKNLFLEKLSVHFASNNIKIYSTPRRLGIALYELPEKTQEKEEIIKGPGLQAPEAAKESFAQKYDLKISDLREIDGRLCAKILVKPIETKDILKEAARHAIQNLNGERWMKWGEGDNSFSRPIRWLLSMAQNNNSSEILELDLFSMKCNKKTRPNRLLEGGTKRYITVENINNYEKTLRENSVEPERAKRKELITNEIKRLEKENNFCVRVNESLLGEVIDLIEYPRLIIGDFDESFLKLPDFLVVTVLEKHQRYFPCFDKNKKLINRFVFVANCMQEAISEVKKGNERVLTARLRDAEFFIKEDSRVPLESQNEKLKLMTFQKELVEEPTMLDKVKRLTRIATKLSVHLKLDDEKTNSLNKIASLLKSDLGSSVVFEFPELQGLSGGFIANAQNEKKEICDAISEHYLPLSSFAELPKTELGAMASLIDKADNLICLFKLDKIPTGSADPFALRRQTQGIVEIFLSEAFKTHTKNISIYELLELVYSEFHAQEQKNTSFEEFLNAQKKAKTSLREFIKQRILFILSSSEGFSKDLAEAFLINTDLRVSPATIRDIALSFEKKAGELKDVCMACRRVSRILKDYASSAGVNENLLRTDAERELNSVINNFKTSAKGWNELLKLTEPINNFFEKILVEDPKDPEASQNRKNLLYSVKTELDRAFSSPDWDKLVNYI